MAAYTHPPTNLPPTSHPVAPPKSTCTTTGISFAVTRRESCSAISSSCATLSPLSTPKDLPFNTPQPRSTPQTQPPANNLPHTSDATAQPRCAAISPPPQPSTLLYHIALFHDLPHRLQVKLRKPVPGPKDLIPKPSARTSSTCAEYHGCASIRCCHCPIFRRIRFRLSPRYSCAPR